VAFYLKAGSNTDSDDVASPMVPMEFLLDELQTRVKKLERWNRWHILNNVFACFYTKFSSLLTFI
jgi:hypothetical protein